MKMLVTPVFQRLKDKYESGNWRQICLMGGTRCFGSKQKVVTSVGSKAISEIEKGDKVLTFNEVTRKDEFKEVLEPLEFLDNKKPAYKITLKNGKVIIVTDDHEFYYKNSWISIKNLLSSVGYLNKDLCIKKNGDQ